MIEYINNYAEQTDSELLLADGFEAALVGIAEGCGRSPAVVYDREKFIAILMDRDGMDRDEANEFFDFNVAGVYVGVGTPVFLVKPEEEQWTNKKSDARIRRLMQQAGLPDSMSLYQAFKQLENEVLQEKL